MSQIYKELSDSSYSVVPPKTKFQYNLNTILKDVVGKLESLAKEVLPKEELDKFNKDKDQKSQK